MVCLGILYDMSTPVEITQLVVQGGALAALVLLLFGIGQIARDVVPMVRDFLGGLLTVQREMLAEIRALTEDAKLTREAVTRQAELSQRLAQGIEAKIDRASDEPAERRRSNPRGAG